MNAQELKWIRQLMQHLRDTGLTRLEWETEGTRIVLENRPPEPSPPPPAPSPYPSPWPWPLPGAAVPSRDDAGTRPVAADGRPDFAPSACTIPDAETVPIPRPEPDAPSGAPVTAPLVGVFYASPSPGAEPFVHVGSRVRVGQTLCILEAMKLMNEVQSPCSGEVVEIAASDGSRVEFGQRLFTIR